MTRIILSIIVLICFSHHLAASKRIVDPSLKIELTVPDDWQRANLDDQAKDTFTVQDTSGRQSVLILSSTDQQSDLEKGLLEIVNTFVEENSVVSKLGPKTCSSSLKSCKYYMYFVTKNGGQGYVFGHFKTEKKFYYFMAGSYLNVDKQHFLKNVFKLAKILNIVYSAREIN